MVNAVVARLYDEARAAVRAGLPTGPFTGVPYLLKDLGALYTGAVTSYGSRLFTGNVADHDSELTARLKRAGLVIVGKSNTPEMGLAPSTEPRLYGPTRNPWKLDHSAGGSSGGAAAAVAAACWRGPRQDGGGSIRIGVLLRFVRPQADAARIDGARRREGWGGASIGHDVTLSVRDSAALLDAPPGPTWATQLGAATAALLGEVGRDPRRGVALDPPWHDTASTRCARRRRGRPRSSASACPT